MNEMVQRFLIAIKEQAHVLKLIEKLNRLEIKLGLRKRGKSTCLSSG